MPYVNEESKTYLAQEGSVPRGSGELNYKITILLLANPSGDEFQVSLLKLFNDYREVEEERYQRYNDITGAAVNAGLEFVRRTKARYDHPLLNILAEVSHDFYDKYAAPYEDKCIERNGDVYPETVAV